MVLLSDALKTGQNRSIQYIHGLALPDAAEAVLRRNRGIQAAKDIRECKEAQLDLSKRGLGDEGAKELAEELKVSELVHWELFVVVRCFVVLRNFRDILVTSLSLTMR
mmetsp:Transcript_20418/g.28711  ORF Transcript_20418/g.28711 Transcript_20418/m.28711 type:complete len:108 (-) Transcript_20418:94-417(-)